MTWHTPAAAALLVVIASAGRIWADLERSQNLQATALEWAAAHQTQSRRPADQPAPSVYWALRSPVREDSVQLLAVVDPATVFSVGAGQEAWVSNAIAQTDLRSLPTEAIPTAALATAYFLGMEIPEEPAHFAMVAEEALSGLDPWFTEHTSRCESCSTRAMPFPILDKPVDGITLEPGQRTSSSVRVTVERYKRSVVNPPTPSQPMIDLVRRIHAGDLPTDEEWQTPGLCGMAALELAAAERVEAEAYIRQAAESGPSATDRIAALWAMRLMGQEHPDLAAIASAL